MVKAFHTERYAKLIEGLVAARHKAGLTQQQVADRLGKPQSYVAKIEGGERRLDLAEFVDYGHALDREAPELLKKMIKSL
tara:strand:+ start:244 stop:483 length:240 start_codon:yes stop_codon:yes gene_type:complete